MKEIFSGFPAAFFLTSSFEFLKLTVDKNLPILTVGSFEELVVWKLSRKFAERVYRVTSIDPFARDFSLRDQLRRSSGSVMDNIAEVLKGTERKSYSIPLYGKSFQW